MIYKVFLDSLLEILVLVSRLLALRFSNSARRRVCRLKKIRTSQSTRTALTDLIMKAGHKPRHSSPQSVSSSGERTTTFLLKYIITGSEAGSSRRSFCRYNKCAPGGGGGGGGRQTSKTIIKTSRRSGAGGGGRGGALDPIPRVCLIDPRGRITAPRGRPPRLPRYRIDCVALARRRR